MNYSLPSSLLRRPLRCILDSSRRFASSTSSHGSDLQVTSTSGVCTVTLNRPERFNAFTLDMYAGLPDVLRASASDPAVRLIVLTGAGNYYSSGNDLNNFFAPGFTIEKARNVLFDFVRAFIDFPKPLVAAVNGPAIGIACTTLALCDAVYSTEEATFDTPFMKIGQSPEGCSSYLFPKIMGQSVANDVLLFGRKLSAAESKSAGLISEIFRKDEFEEEVTKRVQAYAALPPGSMVATKKLIRDRDRQTLHDVNREECDLLLERWGSDECREAVMAFLARKRKA